MQQEPADVIGAQQKQPIAVQEDHTSQQVVLAGVPTPSV